MNANHEIFSVGAVSHGRRSLRRRPAAAMIVASPFRAFRVFRSAFSLQPSVYLPEQLPFFQPPPGGERPQVLEVGLDLELRLGAFPQQGLQPPH